MKEKSPIKMGHFLARVICVSREVLHYLMTAAEALGYNLIFVDSCFILCFWSFAAFERPKSAEKSPLTRRGGFRVSENLRIH